MAENSKIEWTLPAPKPLRPADRFTVAVVALCTGVGFLAGALFSRIVA